MPTRSLVGAVIGAVVLLLAVSFPVTAQETLLRRGDRVRVTTAAPNPQVVVGTLVEWETASIVLDTTDPDSLRGRRSTLVRDQVTKLEASQGQRTQVGKGALVLGGVGLAVGAVVGAAIGSNDEPGVLVGAAVLGGIGLAAGAGIGALIGAIIKEESWEEVPLGQLRVDALLDRRGGLGVSFSVRFS